jgi:hypothetical protein
LKRFRSGLFVDRLGLFRGGDDGISLAAIVSRELCDGHFLFLPMFDCFSKNIRAGPAESLTQIKRPVEPTFLPGTSGGRE